PRADRYARTRGHGRRHPGRRPASRRRIPHQRPAPAQTGALTPRPSESAPVTPDRAPDSLTVKRTLMTIRVMLVDDQVLLRTGFRMVLAAQPDMEVVAEAGDGVEALQALRSTQVDVILMDVRMPKLDGVEATHSICSQPDPPKVLILTTFDLDE